MTISSQAKFYWSGGMMPEILHKFTWLRITWELMTHHYLTVGSSIASPISLPTRPPISMCNARHWRSHRGPGPANWTHIFGMFFSDCWMQGHCHNHSATSSTPSIVKCKASIYNPRAFPSHSFIRYLVPPCQPALAHLHRIGMNLMRRQRISKPMTTGAPLSLSRLSRMQAAIQTIRENAILTGSAHGPPSLHPFPNTTSAYRCLRRPLL